MAGLLALLAMALLMSSAAAREDEVVVISATLEPSQLEIASGTTVTWRNADAERHRVRSREGPERFDSGNLEQGETFSHTFTLDGSYPYSDHRDRDDTAYFGMIIVGAANGTVDGPLPDSGEISIIDRSFRPPSFVIATGGTIEWTNDDGEAHTVTSTDSAFDSGILNGGATFSQSFTEPGSFPYFCLIHPEMRGTITVSDPSETPTAAEPIVEPVSESPAPVGEAPFPSASASPPLDGEPAVAASPPATAPDPSGEASAAPVSSGDITLAGGATVSLVDRSFRPGRIEVGAGETVLWSNDDSEGHTVTAVDGAFNSGVMTVGDEFSSTFDTAGTFDYFCAIHPEMTGTVTVSEPSG